MMSDPARAAAIAVSAAVLSVAACSCGSSPRAAVNSAASQRQMSGATFSGVIYVSTQSTQVTKAFVDHVANVASCAAAARQGDFGTMFKVPSPSLPDPQADIEVSSFHGPGTYPPAALAKDAADTISMTGKSGTDQYVITSSRTSHSRGKEILFLSGDGSGQLVYSDAHLNGQASDPVAAGLIQWSCKS